MYSIKDLSELAGYTSRVYTLISTLHRVHANAYFPPRGTHPELFSLSDVQGTIQKGYDGVRLENVPVVAPSIFPHGGEELIDSLSLIVHSGEHLLVSSYPHLSPALLITLDLRRKRRWQISRRQNSSRSLARLPWSRLPPPQCRNRRHHVPPSTTLPLRRHAPRSSHLPRRRNRDA